MFTKYFVLLKERRMAAPATVEIVGSSPKIILWRKKSQFGKSRIWHLKKQQPILVSVSIGSDILRTIQIVALFYGVEVSG